MLSLSSAPTLPGVSTKDSPSIKEDIKPGRDSKREEGDSTLHSKMGVTPRKGFWDHVYMARGSGSELGKCGVGGGEGGRGEMKGTR